MWRLLSRTTVVLVAFVLLASCEIVGTPTEGYWFKPDSPNGVRVLIIGDSLIRGPAFTSGLKLVGSGYDVLDEAVNATGLVSGAVDWQERAAALIASFHPTHVVIQFAGNFQPPYREPFLPPAEVGTDLFWAWYRQVYGSREWLDANAAAADRLTSLFLSSGVRTYWVVPPPFPPTYGSPAVGMLLWNVIAADLAARYPSVGVLTSPAAHVSTAQGGWLEFKVLCGQLYRIRYPLDAWDAGLHFTSDGAGSYGRAVTRALGEAEGWPPLPPHCAGMED